MIHVRDISGRIFFASLVLSLALMENPDLNANPSGSSPDRSNDTPALRTATFGMG